MLKSVLIKDYMATKLITFTPEMEISEAVKTLNKQRFSGAPVVNDHGSLVGMLSEKDCLKIALQSSYYEDLVSAKVADYMTATVETVAESESVLVIAEKFIGSSFKRFPVLNEEGQLVGQISRSDVLRALELLW